VRGNTRAPDKDLAKKHPKKLPGEGAILSTSGGGVPMVIQKKGHKKGRKFGGTRHERVPNI